MRKAVYQLDPFFKEKFPTKPSGSDIEEQLFYCQQVIETVEKQSDYAEVPTVKEKMNVLKEIVKDFSFELSYSKD